MEVWKGALEWALSLEYCDYEYGCDRVEIDKIKEELRGD